jgi:hypothetical protein
MFRGSNFGIDTISLFIDKKDYENEKYLDSLNIKIKENIETSKKMKTYEENDKSILYENINVKTEDNDNINYITFSYQTDFKIGPGTKHLKSIKIMFSSKMLKNYPDTIKYEDWEYIIEILKKYIEIDSIALMNFRIAQLHLTQNVEIPEKMGFVGDCINHIANTVNSSKYEKIVYGSESVVYKNLSKTNNTRFLIYDKCKEMKYPEGLKPILRLETQIRKQSVLSSMFDLHYWDAKDEEDIEIIVEKVKEQGLKKTKHISCATKKLIKITKVTLQNLYKYPIINPNEKLFKRIVKPIILNPEDKKRDLEKTLFSEFVNSYEGLSIENFLLLCTNNKKNAKFYRLKKEVLDYSGIVPNDIIE